MKRAAKPDQPRILIADDDLSIRRLLATIVRREGLAVDVASDGAEAIEKLQEREYPVILLDLMMPRMDGFDVIEHLRLNPPSRKPVVLVITAYADQKFKEVDPNVVAGVLRKPFEVADIGDIVRLCVVGLDDAADRLAESDRSIRELGENRWKEQNGDTGLLEN